MEAVERKFKAFSSLRDSTIVVGGDHGNEGTEGPDSSFIFTFCVQGHEQALGSPGGEPLDISVELRPHQVAQIVVFFFADLVWKGGIFRKFFKRLLTARYRKMTAPHYRCPEFSGKETVELMKYHQF